MIIRHNSYIQIFSLRDEIHGEMKSKKVFLKIYNVMEKRDGKMY